MKGSAKQFSLFSFFLILIFGILIQNRCTFQAPSKPVWQVQLEIPLINRVFTMEEMIDDTDELTVDSVEQEILFSFEEEIDTVLVGEYLSVNGISINKQYSLGTIRDSVTTPDSLVIERGDIKKGTASVFVKNFSVFPVDVQFELMDLKIGGIPFNVSTRLNPYEEFSDVRDLQGYVFTPPLVDDQNFVRFQAQATGTGGSGEVQIKMDIDSVSFYSIRGWLKDVDVSIEQTEQEITIPEEIKGLEVASAEMEMRILNGIQSPGQMNLSIEGTNDDFGQDHIYINDDINPAPGPDQVGETVITEDVTDFINILPSHVQYSGTIKVGKGYVPGSDPIEIREDDFVTGTVLFRAPLIVKINSRTNEGDIDTLEISEDARNMVRDNLKELSIVADLENHTPLAAEVSLLFSKTVGDSLLFQQTSDQLLTIGSLSLTPAELVVSEISGSDTIWAVGESGMGQWNQVLIDDGDIEYFEEEEIFMGVQIVFLGTQGKQVKVMPSDFIRIKAYGSVKALTKIPEEDEEEGGGA